MSPVGDRPVPVVAGRRPRPSLQILDGGVVHRDHAGTRPGFDRHVADRHALIHRQRFDPGTQVLDHVTGSAVDADASDDRERQVFGGDARTEAAGNVDRHRPRPALQQALRREHVPDLGGPDAEGERAERTVGARVAVAADDGASRLGNPELWTDDVHDAAAVVLHPEELNPELRAVERELTHLPCGRFDGDRHATGDLRRIRRRRVVHGRKGPVRPAQPQSAAAQHVERLRRGDLVHQVQIDVQHGRSLRRLGHYDVPVPDLVEERAGSTVHVCRGQTATAPVGAVRCSTGPRSEWRVASIWLTTVRKARTADSTMSVVTEVARYERPRYSTVTTASPWASSPTDTLRTSNLRSFTSTPVTPLDRLERRHRPARRHAP